MNIHNKPATQEEMEAVCVKIRQQTRELIDQLGSRLAENNRWPKITCAACGRRLTLSAMYRCYYCGLYFCVNCCPDHFGQKRPLMLKLDEPQPQPLKVHSIDYENEPFFKD